MPDNLSRREVNDDAEGPGKTDPCLGQRARYWRGRPVRRIGLARDAGYLAAADLLPGNLATQLETLPGLVPVGPAAALLVEDARLARWLASSRLMILDRLVLLGGPLIVGMAVGYGRGGRLRHISAVQLRGLWMLWLAAGLQAIQFHVEPARRLVQETVGIPMRVLVYGLPVAWFARYARQLPPALRRGASLALVGMASNALPILLNGRMPYVGEAARLAGVPADLMTPTTPSSTPEARLITLGDVIPVPGIHAVLSIGDLLLLTGIAASVTALMLAGPPLQGRILQG